MAEAASRCSTPSEIGAPIRLSTFNGAIGPVPDTSDLEVGSVSFNIDPTTDLPVTDLATR
jgi:hypothetical protein